MNKIKTYIDKNTAIRTGAVIAGLFIYATVIKKQTTKILKG